MPGPDETLYSVFIDKILNMAQGIYTNYKPIEITFNQMKAIAGLGTKIPMICQVEINPYGLSGIKRFVYDIIIHNPTNYSFSINRIGLSYANSPMEHQATWDEKGHYTFPGIKDVLRSIANELSPPETPLPIEVYPGETKVITITSNNLNPEQLGAKEIIFYGSHWPEGLHLIPPQTGNEIPKRVLARLKKYDTKEARKHAQSE